MLPLTIPPSTALFRTTILSLGATLEETTDVVDDDEGDVDDGEGEMTSE